jgi:hypothetical protein
VVGVGEKLPFDMENDKPQTDAIETLAQRLKSDLVEYLRLDNFGQADKPLLIFGKDTYTGNQLADEVENETEVGLKHFFGCIHLASMLICRDKGGDPQARYDAASDYFEATAKTDSNGYGYHYIQAALKIAAGLKD